MASVVIDFFNMSKIAFFGRKSDGRINQMTITPYSRNDKSVPSDFPTFRRFGNVIHIFIPQILCQTITQTETIPK